MSVVMALLTVAIVGFIVACIQAARWASGGSLAGVVPRLALFALACVGVAAFISSRADLEHRAPPSHHPATTALSTLATGVALGVAAYVLSRQAPGGPGSLEWSFIVVAAGAGLGSVAVWWLARSGRLDPLVASVGRLVRWDRTAGPMTVPAPQGSLRPVRREALWGLAMALVFLLGYVPLISDGPLGPDEAVYAVEARSWIEGTPATGFEVYRPIGMPAVAWPILQISDGVVALRVFGVASSVFALGALWALGRNLFSPAAGLLAAGLVAGAPSWLRRVPEFLNDIASAGLLLAVMLLIWAHFERPESHRWLIVFCGPLGAMAFYLRYGVVGSLVIVALVAAVIWHRALAASWRQLLATAAFFAVLATPHFVHARTATGSVIGILTRASDAAGREYVGEGIVTYLRWFPGRLAGQLLALMMAVGVATTLVYLLRAIGGRTTSAAGRAALYAGISAIAMAVAAGLFVHAEQRYVFPTIALLTLVGAHVAVQAYRWSGSGIRIALLTATALVITTAFVINTGRAIEHFDDLEGQRAVVAAAGTAVATAAGSECAVISSYVPEITWESRCHTVGFNRDQVERIPGDVPTYAVVFEHGKRQPTGDGLGAFVPPGSRVAVRVVDEEDRIGDAVIYELDGGVP